MFKRVITLIVLLLGLASNQVFAHSTLTESSPKDGQVVTDPLQEITLQYDTKIEQTSKFEVINSNEESVSIENFKVEENLMKGSFSQPLENGGYKVVWKIAGADGHILDGQFSFTVDVPVEESPNEEQIEENIPQDSEQDKEPEIEQNEENQNKNKEETKNIQETKQTIPNYVIPSISIILLLVGVGLFWWLVRRKK